MTDFDSPSRLTDPPGGGTLEPARAPRPRPRPSRVLVTGVTTETGAALAAQLLARGLRVVGADTEDALARHGLEYSPGFDHLVVAPHPTSPSYVPHLARVLRDDPVDAILPGCGPEGVAALAAGRALFEAHVVAAAPGTLLMLGDALATSARLASRGVVVPDFGVQSDHAHAADLAAFYRGRVVVRPRDDVTVAPRMFTDADEAWRLAGDESLLQEFVPGRYMRALVNRPHSGSAGRVVTVIDGGWFLDEPGGPWTRRPPLTRAAEGSVERAAHAAVRALGITGPAHVQLVLSEDRGPVVVAVSAGFDPQVAASPQIVDAVVEMLVRAA